MFWGKLIQDLCKKCVHSRKQCQTYVCLAGELKTFNHDGVKMHWYPTCIEERKTGCGVDGINFKPKDEVTENG